MIACWCQVSPVVAAVLVVGVLGPKEGVDGGVLLELTLAPLHPLLLVQGLLPAIMVIDY